MASSRKRPLSSSSSSLLSSLQSNHSKSGSTQDAFATLMQSQRLLKKQRRPTRFVACPACGRHVAETNLNHHLDRCIAQPEETFQNIRVDVSLATQKETSTTTNTTSPLAATIHESHGTTAAATSAVAAVATATADTTTTMTTTTTTFVDVVVDDTQSSSDEPATVHRDEEDGSRERLSSLTAASQASTMTLAADQSTRITPETERKRRSSSIVEQLPPPTTTTATTLAPPPPTTTPTTTCRSSRLEKPDTNIFSQMMKASAAQASLAHEVVVYFCLAHDGQVSLTTHMPHNVVWQTTARVVERNIFESPRRPDSYTFRVILGSSVAPLTTTTTTSSSTTATTTSVVPGGDVYNAVLPTPPDRRRRRWVRRHSRFSVPVLKSMLQKAIRRRKPLPAVRLAMELADKSLDDLLRRLPIIVLEDSTLHPDVDFLVWIMMVHHSCCSNNNNNESLPEIWLKRVFRIVFEIAACHWSDPLPPPPAASTTARTSSSVPTNNNNNTATANQELLSLADLHQQLQNGFSSPSESSVTNYNITIPWSILVRSCYGGMKGDMRMLRRYASLWWQRFQEPNVPDHIAHKLAPKRELAGLAVAAPTDTSTTINNNSSASATAAAVVVAAAVVPPQRQWTQIPLLLHEQPRQRVFENETMVSLCQHGLECLSESDACYEGIDDHCASLTKQLLSDEALSGICFDLLILSTKTKMPRDASARKEVLEKVYKSCVWQYRSSVNRRQALEGCTKENKGGPYENLWNELLAERVARYQKDYVAARLSGRS